MARNRFQLRNELYSLRNSRGCGRIANYLKEARRCFVTVCLRSPFGKDASNLAGLRSEVSREICKIAKFRPFVYSVRHRGIALTAQRDLIAILIQSGRMKLSCATYRRAASVEIRVCTLRTPRC